MTETPLPEDPKPEEDDLSQPHTDVLVTEDGHDAEAQQEQAAAENEGLPPHDNDPEPTNAPLVGTGVTGGPTHTDSDLDDEVSPQDVLDQPELNPSNTIPGFEPDPEHPGRKVYTIVTPEGEIESAADHPTVPTPGSPPA